MSRPDSAWQGGAALLPFPVPSDVPLAGYAARTGPAVGVLDELAIVALLLTRGADQLAIVAADVAGADAGLADEVAQAAGLAQSELALCATHTHSGPAGITARLHPADPDRLDRGLRARFVTTASATLASAGSQSSPRGALTDRSRRYSSTSPVTRPSLAPTTGSSQQIFRASSAGSWRRRWPVTEKRRSCSTSMALPATSARGSRGAGRTPSRSNGSPSAWHRQPVTPWRPRSRSGDRFDMVPQPCACRHGGAARRERIRP
jgi:hypothetical protein